MALWMYEHLLRSMQHLRKYTLYLNFDKLTWIPNTLKFTDSWDLLRLNFASIYRFWGLSLHWETQKKKAREKGVEEKQRHTLCGLSTKYWSINDKSFVLRLVGEDSSWSKLCNFWFFTLHNRSVSQSSLFNCCHWLVVGPKDMELPGHCLLFPNIVSQTRLSSITGGAC